MKRLLAIGHAQDGSGFARVLRGILGGLCASFDVHQLALCEIGRETGGLWTRHPCERDDVYGFAELRRLQAALRPDSVLILHDLWIIPGYLSIFESLSIPIVAYMPLDGRLNQPESVYALRRLDCLVTYVPSARKQLERAFAEMDGNCADSTPHLETIPHGIDQERFYPVERAREKLFPDWDEREGAFLVLNANQNQPRKQLNVTLEAFARFAKGKGPDVKLCLHSAPNGCVPLREEAARLGISSRLILTGETVGIGKTARQHPLVAEEKLNWIYNACNVGVNTSSGEGWGLVSFEHAATGAAQIVPGHSACADLWNGAAEMVHTVLDPPSRHSPLRMSQVSVEGAAAAMERLYQDDARRAQLAEAGRRRAMCSEFAWPAVTARWQGLLEKITS